MSLHWENWSESVRFKANHLARPGSIEELQEIIHESSLHHRHVRPIGSSHSSTQIFETDDTLLSLENIKGLLSSDPSKNEATLFSGTTILEMGELLHDVGLAPHNLGDVALQRIAGAISTGTHGTGEKLGNLSTMLIGGKFINGMGEIISFGTDTPELLKAARVSLGMLGIFTEMKLRLQPNYKLTRKEYFTTFESCIKHLPDLISKNRHFDFYWYPRSDEVKLRIMNPPGEGMEDISWAKLDEKHTDWASKILHKHTNLENKFEEMEYELPFEKGAACFLKIRERILERWRPIVAWRVLYRTIAEDDSYLSPAFKRKSVSISLHQNAGLPYQDFFLDMEPIFKEFDGRPHWAKKHSMKFDEISPLYPKLKDFLEIRNEFDPHGVFLSPYLKSLMGLGKSL